MVSYSVQLQENQTDRLLLMEPVHTVYRQIVT